MRLTVEENILLTSGTIKQAMAAIEPPPELLVSQWADSYRMLSQESSPEPGKWNTGRAPYQRGPMNAFNEAGIERIVLMASTQTMKTEVLLNTLGYVIDQDPAPIMYVMSTLELAKSFSKDRLAPMIRDTPRLRAKVADPRARESENTTLHKKFPGGYIVIAGSNSPDALAFRPVKILLLDEVDRYPLSAGTEGDPVSLAIKRTANFFNRKIILASSPTIKEASRIEAAFMQSDQRYYNVPCPKCKGYQVLKWPNLKWEKEDINKNYYQCQLCGHKIEEGYKEELLNNGLWKKTGEGDGKTAGFHINELYSPWVKWSEMIAYWKECQGKPEMLKTFINTSLAETYEERGEAPEWERLYMKREQYPRNIVPAGGILLVAGVDVQANRLEIEIKAYGRGRESWSIDYRVIPGSPDEPQTWQMLEAIINESFKTEAGRELKILLTAIDSGYSTTNVYLFGRKMGSDRVMVIKGRDRMNTILSAPSAIDLDYHGRKIKRGVQLWHIGVKIIKSELYSSLRLNHEPGTPYPDGYYHFPDYPEEYFRQLTAEELVKRKTRTGLYNFEYKKIRDRNEVLDCNVYCRAAAAALGIDRYTEEEWNILEGQLKHTPEDKNTKAKKRIINRGIKL